MDKVNKNRLSDSGALDKDSKELRNVTGDEVSRFNGVFSKKQKQPDKDEKFNSRDEDCDDIDTEFNSLGTKKNFIESTKNTKSKGTRNILGDNREFVPAKENNRRSFLEADLDTVKDDRRFEASGDDASAAQSNIQSAAGANPGDAILNNLNKYSEFYRTDGIRGAQTQAAKVVQLVGNAIVERMLASSAALDAKQEVRIFLKNDILAQTEVRIAKENTTGVLSVEFHTHSDESAKFLSVNQSGLQQHLMNNLRDVSGVDIKIFHESAGNGQNNIVVEVQGKPANVGHGDAKSGGHHKSADNEQNDGRSMNVRQNNIVVGVQGKPASVEHGDAKSGGHHKSADNEQNDGRSRQEYVGDLDEDEKKKDKK